MLFCLPSVCSPSACCPSAAVDDHEADEGREEDPEPLPDGVDLASLAEADAESVCQSAQQGQPPYEEAYLGKFRWIAVGGSLNFMSCNFTGCRRGLDGSKI